MEINIFHMKTLVCDCQSNDPKDLFSQDQPTPGSLMSCRYSHKPLSWVQYSTMCWLFLISHQFSGSRKLFSIFKYHFSNCSVYPESLKSLALSLNELYEIKDYKKEDVKTFTLAALHWQECHCK